MIRIRNAKESAIMDSINLTSLTDVLLTLLVLFMVLETYSAGGFVVQLPGLGLSEPPGDPTVYVKLDSRGGITLRPGDGPPEMPGIDSFEARMSALRRQKGFDRVVILADPQLEYRHILPLMDKARGVGFVRILLDQEGDENHDKNR